MDHLRALDSQDLAVEVRQTMRQLSEAVSLLPSQPISSVQHNRRAALLAHVADVQAVMIQHPHLTDRWQPQPPPSLPPPPPGGVVRRGADGAIVTDSVPVATEISPEDPVLPFADAVPIIPDLASAGQVAAGVTRWCTRTRRTRVNQDWLDGGASIGTSDRQYRDSVERLRELRKESMARHELVLQKAADAASHSAAATATPTASCVHPNANGAKTSGSASDESIREYLLTRQSAAAQIQRSFRTRSRPYGHEHENRVPVDRRPVEPRPGCFGAPSLSNRATVQSSLQQPPPPQPQTTSALDSADKTYAVVPVTGNNKPPRKNQTLFYRNGDAHKDHARADGEANSGPEGNGVCCWSTAGADTAHAIRPAGKLHWLRSVRGSLEKLVVSLDGSQAVKASTALAPLEKAAHLQLMYREPPSILSLYFTNFYAADVAEAPPEDRERLVAASSRLLRGVYGLRHPLPGPECGLTAEDHMAVRCCVRAMVEAGVRTVGRPLSIGHGAAIERDTFMPEKEAEDELSYSRDSVNDNNANGGRLGPCSYARMVQRLLVLVSFPPPKLELLPDSGSSDGEEDQLSVTSSATAVPATFATASAATATVQELAQPARPANPEPPTPSSSEEPVATPRRPHPGPGGWKIPGSGSCLEAAVQGDSAEETQQLFPKLDVMNSTWRGEAGAWKPVAVVSSSSVLVDSMDEDEDQDMVEMSFSDSSFRDSGDSTSLTPRDRVTDRMRRVNVGEGGSTPVEVREFVATSSDEEASAGRGGSGSGMAACAAHAWEILAGGTAINLTSSVAEPVEVLRIEGEILGLYFGCANDWACRSFEEELRELEQEQGGLGLDILFCCSDALESEAAHEEHLRDLPCAFALPHADGRIAALASYFGMDWQDVPQIVLIDAEGQVSSNKGCERVRELLQERRLEGALEDGNAALKRSEASDAFDAYFAFRRGLQHAPSHGPLIAGEASARERLPPPLLKYLPCSAGGWRFNMQATVTSPPPQLAAEVPPVQGGDEAAALQCPTCGAVLAPLPSGLVQAAGDQPGACDGEGCDTTGTIAELKIAGYRCCLDCDFGLCKICQSKHTLSSNEHSASSGGDGDGRPGPLAEGGRALLIMHINSGSQVTIWEDAPGFFVRLPQKQSMREIRLKKPKTILEFCCAPHSHAPLPLAELAASAALLSAEALPAMPCDESFARLKSSEDTAIYVKNQMEMGVSFTWGETIHLANDSTPWLVRRFEDGGVLITDHNWRGGSLFLGPDGAIVFGGNVASLPIRPTPNLGGYTWVQRRCKELLSRAAAVRQSEPDVGPLAAFGAFLTLREGAALDKKHAGLSQALMELTVDPAWCVTELDVRKPQLFGQWLVSECETAPISSTKVSTFLLLAHPVGVQLALHRAGGFGFRMVVHGGRQWELQISDAGWQDFVPSSLQAEAGMTQMMPTVDAFQQAGDGAGAPQLLSAAGPARMCWSSRDGAEHWGLLRDDGADTMVDGEVMEDGSGLTVVNVGTWLGAWLGNQPPCACLRLLSDGGVCLADADGGWTGFCITPDALALSADEARSSLRLGGVPASVGGWAIGVATHQEDLNALVSSIGGLLLCSHAASGKRIAFREYDHAYWLGDSKALESDGLVESDVQLRNDGRCDGGMDALLSDSGAEPPAAAQFKRVEELAVLSLPPGALCVCIVSLSLFCCPTSSCFDATGV